MFTGDEDEEDAFEDLGPEEQQALEALEEVEAPVLDRWAARAAAAAAAAAAAVAL
jgi:hypothetical protein